MRMHLNIEVVPFGLGGADVPRIGIAFDPFLVDAGAFGRATAALRAFGARRKQAMRRAEDPLPTVRCWEPVPSAPTPVCGLLRFTARLVS